MNNLTTLLSISTLSLVAALVACGGPDDANYSDNLAETHSALSTDQSDRRQDDRVDDKGQDKEEKERARRGGIEADPIIIKYDAVGGEQADRQAED